MFNICIHVFKLKTKYFKIFILNIYIHVFKHLHVRRIHNSREKAFEKVGILLVRRFSVVFEQ